MTEKLIITDLNESYIRINCSESVAMELSDTFSFRPPGFQFVPSYRKRVWDGWIRMFNIRSRQILRGLAPDIQRWAVDRGYECEYVTEPDENISLIEAKEFIENLNLSHTIRDYQVDGFVHAIRSKRKVVVSPTGSGKSLIQYCLFNFLMRKGMKGLIIVPRAQLVEQMVSDFGEYSSKNGKDMNKYCHKVYSGRDKQTDKPLVVSTWQSLAHLPPSYFQQFQYVIVDECHGAIENKQDAKVITKIVSQMVNAKFRIGVTGTLPTERHAILSLTGLLGDSYKVISTSELMERKQLADLNIKCLVLQYSAEECKYMKTSTYQEEIEYIVGHSERNKFITNLALSLEGNTLLLFNLVEKHGKVLYGMLNSKAHSGRKVFLIHGGVGVDEREEIRKIVETENNAIIVGSSGCLSTGTNIINLSNIIFAGPSKSRIRVLQSIGRILRRSEQKVKATLFDISDDFSHRNHANYTLRHFLERIKIYAKEQFSFRVYKIGIKK